MLIIFKKYGAREIAFIENGWVEACIRLICVFTFEWSCLMNPPFVDQLANLVLTELSNWAMKMRMDIDSIRN